MSWSTPHAAARRQSGQAALLMLRVLAALLGALVLFAILRSRCRPVVVRPSVSVYGCSVRRPPRQG